MGKIKYGRLFFLVLVPLLCLFAIIRWVNCHYYTDFHWGTYVVVPALLTDAVILWIYIVLGGDRVRAIYENRRHIFRWFLIFFVVVSVLFLVLYMLHEINKPGNKPAIKKPAAYSIGGKSNGRVLTEEELNRELGIGASDRFADARFTLAGAMDANPEEEAKIREMARERGVPVEIARSGYEGLKKLRAFDKVDKSPTLQIEKREPNLTQRLLSVFSLSDETETK